MVDVAFSLISAPDRETPAQLPIWQCSFVMGTNTQETGSGRDCRGDRFSRLVVGTNGKAMKTLPCILAEVYAVWHGRRFERKLPDVAGRQQPEELSPATIEVRKADLERAD